MDTGTLLVVVAVVAVVVVILLIFFGKHSGSGGYEQRKAEILATPLPAGVLERVRRPTFLPTCEQHETSGPVSKFSGCPWLPEGTAWPVCSLCHKPMQLFLQLALDDLPEGGPGPRGGGLLQVFYCTNYEAECEQDDGWAGETTSMKLLRIVDPSGPGSTPQQDLSFDPQPAHTITGWTREDDCPNPDDLALFFPDMEEAVQERISWDDATVTVCDDKLGGWPDWIQGNEWHECDTCGERMEFLFQIASDEHTGYMFGDVGTAHLLRCARHPEQMTFGWACS